MIISANIVKDLREKTGAGMMDCKRALTESGGDFEAAVDWLRKKGLSAAAKKSDRIAAEGLVAVATVGNIGAVIELNSETDFVAKNDKFQTLASNLAKEYLQNALDLEDFKGSKYSPTGRSVSEEISEHIAVIGENMNLRRVQKLSVNEGVVASYVHNQVIPGLGKIGVLVALESNLPADKLQQLGRQLAMHIAAAKPESCSVAELDPVLVSKEKNLLSEQARASGKPENVIEKMVEGRMQKFFEQVVLLEQIFVVDGETKIADIIANAAKGLGHIEVKGFARFALGEGVEKKEENFAEEVAKVAGA